MKHLLILILLFVSTTGFCQVDRCIMFKVRLNLSSGEVINGYYFNNVGDLLFDYKNKVDSITFHLILERLGSNSDSITIYKNLNKLQNIKQANYNLLACSKNDIIKISLNEIIIATEISSDGCCDSNSIDFKYQGFGFWPPVITELDDLELNLLQKEVPIHYFDYYDSYFDDGLQFIKVISYNEDLTPPQIKAIISDQCSKGLRPNDFKYTDLIKNYLRLKEQFNDKEIYLLRINYYN